MFPGQARSGWPGAWRHREGSSVSTAEAGDRLLQKTPCRPASSGACTPTDSLLHEPALQTVLISDTEGLAAKSTARQVESGLHDVPAASSSLELMANA
jgi:hypothetical protein